MIISSGLNNYIKNTYNSIMLAKKNNKIDGIIIDVRSTLDNKLVLMKFNNLKVDTLSLGLVSKKIYKELKKVKYKDKIHKDYILELETILKIFNENKIIIINLHDNYDKNEELVLNLKNILDKYKYNYYIETSSKNLLSYLIKHLNNYKIGIIYNYYPDIVEYGIDFCDIKPEYINNNIYTYNTVIYRNVTKSDKLNFDINNLIIPSNINTYIRQENINN